MPVHVVTVNDYLVERDAAALEPFFRALGLTVDRVLAADAPERRRRAWRADVVYCTAHELMFDYLRDRLAGLFGVRRDRIEAPIALAPFLREIGDTVALTEPRLGLSARPFRVLGLREDAGTGNVTMILWG